MGVKEVIVAGIKTGLQATGNVRRTVTYKAQSADPSYAPATGTVTRPETSHTVEGLLYGYRRDDIDGVLIRPFDQQFLVHQSELPVTPKVTERLVLDDGTSWEIVRVEQDPAGATWMLQIRSQ
jgi:hypothetical protein